MKLEERWHFGEGSKICEKSVLISIAITRKLNRKLDFIEAFSTEDGYVNLRLGISKDRIVGLLIESKSKIIIYTENNISIKKVRTVELKDIINTINSLVEEIKWEMLFKKCVTLNYYTANIIQESMKNFYHTCHLSSEILGNGGKVYHYSEKVVQKNVMETSINIFMKEEGNSRK